jgi:hypothetical protein
MVKNTNIVRWGYKYATSNTNDKRWINWIKALWEYCICEVWREKGEVSGVKGEAWSRHMKGEAWRSGILTINEFNKLRLHFVIHRAIIRNKNKKLVFFKILKFWFSKNSVKQMNKQMTYEQTGFTMHIA